MFIPPATSRPYGSTTRDDVGVFPSRLAFKVQRVATFRCVLALPSVGVIVDTRQPINVIHIGNYDSRVQRTYGKHLKDVIRGHDTNSHDKLAIRLLDSMFRSTYVGSTPGTIVPSLRYNGLWTYKVRLFTVMRKSTTTTVDLISTKLDAAVLNENVLALSASFPLLGAHASQVVV